MNDIKLLRSRFICDICFVYCIGMGVYFRKHTFVILWRDFSRELTLLYFALLEVFKWRVWYGPKNYRQLTKTKGWIMKETMVKHVCQSTNIKKYIEFYKTIIIEFRKYFLRGWWWLSREKSTDDELWSCLSSAVNSNLSASELGRASANRLMRNISSRKRKKKI